MKKITFVITLCLVANIIIGQDLLTNGGFEPPQETGKVSSASSPWSSSVANVNLQSSVINNPDVARTGEQFLAMGNDFTNIRQSFTASPGTEYTLNLWYQYIMGQGTPDASDGIFVSIRQDSGGNGTQFDPVISIYLDPSIVDNTWQEANLVFTAPQANLLLFITKQSRAAGGPNNGARMDDISITDNSLSVQDLTQYGFTVYPNPVNDVIKLNAQEKIEKVEIFNLLGQQVLTTQLNVTNAQINVSELNDGVYLMRTFINGISGTNKFVKK